ncbi:hypothetical protein GCM10022383_26460 [Microbacterium soli]|uniref:Cytochrome b561 bacterial/Ni-hydrogenase domain-containing protein n=1 Tax=Microbacterium soli TaxID=446075 RepID=A0ABP7NHX4_9MICO
MSGGEPWPPAGEVPEWAVAPESTTPDPAVAPSASGPAHAAPAAERSVETEAAAVPGAPTSGAPEVPAVSAPAGSGGAPAVMTTRSLRRGLPRVTGEQPWPPAGEVSVPAVGSVAVGDAPGEPIAAHAPEMREPDEAHTAAEAGRAAAPAASGGTSDTPLRRGLPRVAGGEPWPAAGFAPASPAAEPAPAASAPSAESAPAVPAAPPAGSPAPRGRVRTGLPATPRGSAPEAPAQKAAEPPAPREAVAAAPARATTPEKAPAEAPRAVAAPAPASAQAAGPAKPKREPVMIGSRTLAQWVKLGVLCVVGAVVAAAIIVLAARGVTTLPGVPEFLKRFPGEYELPETTEPGFPAWARWTHFLNFFLMILIIRTGLQVRNQQKPPAFWTSKRGGKKISINLWLHTSLDVLWLVNGVVFVVLLFASGHWARIVPTSWEVFPNAASALLQYLTLDWPTENGWVNYNSLQQIMYFLVVFVAAPLAAITGVRMSEWWPKNAEKLNKIYPATVARALHFPTMIFFVLFIIIHVFLVFATGALRNLNHMYAGTDVVNWTGFWLFAAAIAVTVGAWFAARPLILAPIAGLFGKVSNR